MTNAKLNRLARGLALVAGGLDLATGAGLVVMPALTLQLMGAAAPGAEALVFVRFVGAFVGAVGASYLVALIRGGAALRAVFAFTIIFRLSAGTFCAVALGLGWLGSAWASVTATDYALVIIQGWLLAKGVGRAA